LGLLILIASAVDKTLWDWLNLLIVPVVLALGGYLFTRSENQRARREAENQHSIDRDIANQRAKTDRDIANQHRQGDALQAYLDQMGQLLLDKNKPLRCSKEGDDVRNLARARTLTVLWLLDGSRKGSLLQFLYEARLINRCRLVLNLSGAYLVDAHLWQYKLSRADLSDATLSGANLSGANLSGADLSDATLSGANLSRGFKNMPDGSKVSVSGADLSGANLSEAEVTGEQLSQAKSLEGATMPDGQVLKSADNPDGPTLEEWLKRQGE
jgi:hypothetical protein